MSQAIKEERKILLIESDWTQMPDSPLTEEQKAEWATYRQALRDMTLEDMDNRNYPTPPNL